MNQPRITTPDVFDRFGVDASRCTRVLREALSRGGDYADLFFEHRVSGSLTLDDGKLRGASRSVNLGVGVRTLKGGATGYAYTEDLTMTGLLAAARTAASVASGGGDPPEIEVKGASALNLYPIDESPFEMPAAEKLVLMRRAEAAAHAYSAHISRVTVSLMESQREILVVTSDGRYVGDSQPMLRFNVHVVAAREGDRQVGTAGGGGRFGMEYFATHPPEEAGEEASRIATVMLDAIDAPAGQLPVVLGPGDSGVLLHEAVGHGLEADFNRKQTSNYSGRVGERVASPLVTVVDDGMIEGSRGSINVDDEGNAPGRHVLIEDGILRGYLHDHLSTEHYGAASASAGNGRRQDYKHVPMPRMTNTYMLGGPHDADEIVESVKYGIYAKAFSGGQVNISNGDFVFSVTEGYLIEDGKITAPVKGVNLIGNGPDCMTQVSMVGSDFALSDGRWTCGKDGQSVPVGIGVPTMKIDAITVGGINAG
ncbi:MAG: TldD protein [Bradymonadia bacterium]|jgi:TldD protein